MLTMSTLMMMMTTTRTTTTTTNYKCNAAKHASVACICYPFGVCQPFSCFFLSLSFFCLYLKHHGTQLWFSLMKFSFECLYHHHPPNQKKKTKSTNLVWCYGLQFSLAHICTFVPRILYTWILLLLLLIEYIVQYRDGRGWKSRKINAFKCSFIIISSNGNSVVRCLNNQVAHTTDNPNHMQIQEFCLISMSLVTCTHVSPNVYDDDENHDDNNDGDHYHNHRQIFFPLFLFVSLCLCTRINPYVAYKHIYSKSCCCYRGCFYFRLIYMLVCETH